MAILGMVVNLKTFDSGDAGTDDEIYIGFWGRGGGREIPLSSRNHDDFERGADDFYIVGIDPGFGFPLLRSERSAPGEANDPALVPIDLGGVRRKLWNIRAIDQWLDQQSCLAGDNRSGKDWLAELDKDDAAQKRKAKRKSSVGKRLPKTGGMS